MAANRISFDNKDAKLIRAAIKTVNSEGNKSAQDLTRIDNKIKGYLDIQGGKAPSKLEKQKAAKKAPKAPKAKAPAKKAAPKAKAPAKKAASKPAKKDAAPKAPKADKAPIKLPDFPKAYDAD